MRNKKHTKLVLAGGSGFIGKILIKRLRQAFDEIVVLSRKPLDLEETVRVVRWDGHHAGKWMEEIDGADLLINLSGRSVNCRYHAQNREEILQSRTKSTLALGAAVIAASHPPKCWMNASSATIYDDEYTLPHTEEHGRIGNDFSMDVCKQWESTFNEVPVPGTRKVILRMGLVLGSEGGVFPELLSLVDQHIGKKFGSGKQRVSWIHEEDLAEAVLMLWRTEAEGIFNLTAPHHPTNAEMMAQLFEARGVKFALELPEWMIEMGAWMKNTEAELMLKSRYVMPRRLLDRGYEFRFATFRDATSNLLRHELVA